MGSLEDFDKEKFDSEIKQKNRGRSLNLRNENVQELRTKENTRDEKIQFHPPPESTLCAFCMTDGSCKTAQSRTKLMHTLLEKGKPREASSVFNNLIQGGHEPTLITYTTLLASLTAQKRFEYINIIISQVEKKGLGIDPVYINALVNAFAESGNMIKAMQMFESMGNQGMKPSVGTFNTLIKGYGISGMPEESMKIMELMMSKEEYTKPNLRTYNVLVRAWCNKNRINEARDIVTKMVEHGIEPDAVTYNTLISAYAQYGQTTEAESVVLEMRENEVGPNERTCGIIISGYCREGKIRDGLRFAYKMKELGLCPNLVVFNSLVKGFLDVSDRNGVDEVLLLMEEFGVKPDVITFSTIMNAWSAAGYMIKCREIFDDMVRAGIRPDVHAYSILAKGYVRAQEPERAEQLLEAMKGSGVCQNVVIFTTIISGWCSSGSMESGIRVFEKMVDEGISPNLRTFEAIIGGYAENKKPGKAEEVLLMMEKFNVLPEKSTFKLVAEAWRGVGMRKEMNRRKIEMRSEVNLSFSRLRIPDVVLSDQREGVGLIKKNRTVLREGESSFEGSKVKNLMCQLVIRRRRLQAQLYVSGQLGPLCTVFLLN